MVDFVKKKFFSTKLFNSVKYMFNLHWFKLESETFFKRNKSNKYWFKYILFTNHNF